MSWIIRDEKEGNRPNDDGQGKASGVGLFSFEAQSRESFLALKKAAATAAAQTPSGSTV
jgi:hypothetical protein